MLYLVIPISVLLFLSCEANADWWDWVIGCYSIDNDGTTFNFYCSNAEKMYDEKCSKATLSEAVQKLNASAVIELKMCGCELDTLVNAKKQLENVRFLDISHSNYESDDLFNGRIVDVLFNRKLVKLNATHNHLTEIPNKLSYKMPNVTMIDLSHNQLEEINWEAFKHNQTRVSELKEIHLQQNHIEYFLGADTPEINKLKYLDLRDNSLDGRIDCRILSLLFNNHPIQMYISWRNIVNLDLRCIKSEFMVRFNEFESITFRNGIVELHCNQFSFRNIREIRAKTNQMKNLYEIVSIVGLTLESLEQLDVSGSDLMEFDFSILSKMKKLCALNIRDCNLKKVINPSALQSISIEYFNADGNQIQNVHEIIEHLNPSIEYLYLSGNKIGKLHSTAITKMKNLKYLVLSNTNLQLVDSHYPFDHQERLQHIDISNNNLNKVNCTISFPSKLEYLNVSGCQIENVLDVIQLQGTKVVSLDLSSNFVGTLNDTAFDLPTSVEYLYLKNTSLSFSDSNPFYKLDLRRLDISNNNLKNVNFTILSSTLNKLDELKAANCNIENVFDVIKRLPPDIQMLDLSGNVVGKIDASTFDRLTKSKQKCIKRRVYEDEGVYNHPKIFERRLSYRFSHLWRIDWPYRYINVCMPIGSKSVYLRNTSLSINDGSNPFKNFNTLYVLDISQNNLSNVNWTIFSSSLSGLKQLSVAECQIENPLDLINLLGSSIQYLDLSGNSVGEVNASLDASTFERLENLHLSNTSLLNFNFNMLEHTKQLKLLDISFNRFTKLNVSLKFNNLQTLDLRGCELNEIHNCDKIHLPNLKSLGISKNRLSCETLEQFKNEWPSLKFIDNDQSQTDQPNCQKPKGTTTDKPTKVLEPFKPFKFRAPHIVSMILSVVFFIGILFLLFRYILCEKRCDNYTLNNDNEMEVLQRVDGVGAANNDAAEHIYEEIVEQIDSYDRLNFDPAPSTALQQHYENAPEPIDEPEIVSNASESIESYEEIGDSISI